MPLTDIHGQDAAIITLRNALAHGRLGHAHLFTGPPGVGKKRTALALAQALFCRVKPQEGCGVCTACLSVMHGTHPDVLIVAPAAGKRDISIDQVRELQRLIGLRAVQGGKKIALVDNAHLLNAAAQSALLKVLEEPLGDALLILLTVNAATLSRPLLSRCQQVRFSALALAVVEKLLIQEHGKDSQTAHLLACYSRGSLGDVLALDPQAFSETRRQVVEELQRLRGASFTTISRLSEWLVADRGKKSAATQEAREEHAAGDRLAIVLSWYEEVLHYTVLGQDGVIRYQDSLGAVAQAAAGLSVAGALRHVTVVHETIQALARNANRQLAVEDMLLQLAAA